MVAENLILRFTKYNKYTRRVWIGRVSALCIIDSNLDREEFNMREIKGGFDLHMHSNYSDDGEFSPAELVRRCRDAGIGVMAISDHNCAKANEEAAKTAKENGIFYIPAIEIDCTFEGVDLHVLGYGINRGSRDFVEIEENIARQNLQASLVRLEKIRDLGFSVTEEEMDRAEGDGYWKHVWPGELFAEVLLKKPEYFDHELLRPYRPGGVRSDNPYVNFYWDFCSQGKLCHSPILYPSLKDTVEIIHGNGGKTVLAHPGNNLRNCMELLDPVISSEMDGIEAFCSYHEKIKPSVSIGGHGCTLDQEVMKEYVERLVSR